MALRKFVGDRVLCYEVGSDADLLVQIEKYNPTTGLYEIFDLTGYSDFRCEARDRDESSRVLWAATVSVYFGNPLNGTVRVQVPAALLIAAAKTALTRKSPKDEHTITAVNPDGIREVIWRGGWELVGGQTHLEAA